ncbi:MAG TPA: UvrD-helicase domain-containing protein [Opitutaceae bacterium]|jgi:ATP-dependent helicase/nuclease subunit A|nr:UvrD-helicase domain-containing protein [Opitutaceae bacterium]
MNEGRLSDQAARDRFRDGWTHSFAVSANAGSGKTTAISERLAAMALAPGGAELLKKTAVVTFTKNAAAQIGQRAREVLLNRLTAEGRADLAPLDSLERAFFGTIHSFCLLLAQRHGQTLGVNLNPTVVQEREDDDGLWEEFVGEDAMQFAALPTEQIDAFLRHVPLDSVFELARKLDPTRAKSFLERKPRGGPAPDESALAEILAATTKNKKGAEALGRNQRAATEWLRRFRGERSYLPLAEPQGKAAGIEELFARFFAPLKAWLAEAGAVLAAELSERYRAWRFERGVQTYPDQIEAALAVLRDAATLEKIRGEGWRVILDEAQDTDPEQFAVLVEITRPPGAPLGTWPANGGPPPRPGFFCMVGDGQQAIYGSRADIRKFQQYLAAFARGDGGEQLTFTTTFRTPRRVATLLNATLPAAFGPDHVHNFGLPPAAGAPAPLLQTSYEPLEPAPNNAEGSVLAPEFLLNLEKKAGVEARLAAEVRVLAAWLHQDGPAAVGARSWGEVCMLAPRNEWLVTARKELEAAGLKVALQMRRNRNGDNPPFAWLCGLLAALCDPHNTFEWVGVLREIFMVSDAQIAGALREDKVFHWDEPDRYVGALHDALATLRPFVLRVDEEGGSLESFSTGLVRACTLGEKARRIDPGGAFVDELERLLAHAAELGLTGAGPRAWLHELLDVLDDGRPAGKPAGDAINLLTSHSAKGLEWPVVIPIGLWRAIRKPPNLGLQLVNEAGVARVFFDGESLPAETRDARERERLRENVRLLYVTLTRSRRTLVLPRVDTPAEPGSFLELWGADLTARLPSERATGEIEIKNEPVISAGGGVEMRPLDFKLRISSPALPARVLPHQLAHAPDAARTARHESALDEPLPLRAGDDPIDYGLWWHETLEFWPWEGGEAAREAHVAGALAAAEAQGFRQRGAEELAKFRASGLYAELGTARWTRLAELSVFAPLRADAWIDGVIDLVAHDAAARQVVVVDWKTNRRRLGEGDDALLARLAAEYAPQLAAYGACVRGFFPGCAVELRVFASASGTWRAAGN